MGGAASSASGLEQMVACTFLLGQALSRAYPEIYTLNDFHADKEMLQKQLQKEHEKRMKSMKRVPLVFLGPDGTVTPVQFLDENGNTIGGELTDEKRQGSTKQLEDAHDDQDEDAEEDEHTESVPLDQCIVLEFQGRQVPIKLDTIHQPNEDGWNVLHACCHQQATAEQAKEIIEVYRLNGYNIDAKTKRGPGSYANEWTPLHMACAYGIKEVVSALISAGADVNTKNSVGWMPLHEAVHRGYVDICTMLVQAGSKLNNVIPSTLIAPYHPQYPLAHACRQGHSKIVRILLDGGANMNAQNEGGWSALHECVFFRHEECAKVLIMFGADLTLETSQGYTVLDFEASPEITQMLMEVAPAHLVQKVSAKRQASKQIANLPGENKGEAAEEKTEKPKPSYRLLGDLPSLDNNVLAGGFSETLANAKPEQDEGDQDDDDDDVLQRERQERIKNRKQQRKNRQPLKGAAPPEHGVPPEYACQLTGKLLQDPVTTLYGTQFERSAVIAWIKSQGNICPVTGQPLSESDCLVDKDLRIEISDWQLKQALGMETACSPKAASGGGARKSAQICIGDSQGVDLYDF